MRPKRFSSKTCSLILVKFKKLGFIAPNLTCQSDIF